MVAVVLATAEVGWVAAAVAREAAVPPGAATKVVETAEADAGAEATAEPEGRVERVTEAEVRMRALETGEVR